MKHLAAAIAFGVLVFAYMFQWEYDEAGSMRTNRFTGELHHNCIVGYDFIGYMSKSECKAKGGIY